MFAAVIEATVLWYRFALDPREEAHEFVFPFWDLVLAPVIESVEAKRIVEIGALRGETTTLMLEALDEDAELHVVDPVPEFDPSEHERAFPGRYIFHRDISHNVLPRLGPVDVALIDGDHNWYTVYHELRMLREAAESAGAPLPVFILHDVCWPYGRRDLYYSPERIPEEFRQPYEQRGIRPGTKKVIPSGGLNPTMNNAVAEGGPRNGVMTAVDDFIAECGREMRLLVLPVYFGLAIVVEASRLRENERLSAVLAHLETAEGRNELMELAEDMRLRAMIFQHNVLYQFERRYDRLVEQHLDLLKGALLDEHYFENELRIDHLAQCMERKLPGDALKLRDPLRYMREQADELRAARRAGDQGHDDVASYFPYTTVGRVRLDALQQLLDTVRTEKVLGDLVDCGTKRGGTAIFMRAYLATHDIPSRVVWVVDRFRASPERDAETADAAPAGARGFPTLLADLNNVRDGFARFGLLDDRVRFLQGDYADSLTDHPIERVALLRIDAGADAYAVLDRLYSRLSMGGFVYVDDYADPATREAVDRFRAERGLADRLERIDDRAISWRKTAGASRPAPQIERSTPPQRLPLARTATKPCDLSVVVIFYNMRREAQRTLHSLSRAYQEDLEGIDYEVVVVENGSRADEKLGEEFVTSFGPNFVYVDMGDDAAPSPIPALNRGIAMSSGDVVALMIDGAHVLTPRVLHYGVAGIATYGTAIVATQQWYVGPGQQGEAMSAGYDEPYEDRLFDEIEWPTNGYRLFDIGHFIGDRDWFDGLWESNCIFVPRSLLEQVGGFDEHFSMPGGGYANLELYERLGSSPDVKVVTIIGEGSFHQVHGGTTTNQSSIDERRGRVSSYARHFEEIRGRQFRGPGKTIHYIGAMHRQALRTKARRRTAPNVFNAVTARTDGLPESPVPIPQDVQTEFVDAYWRTLAWQATTWLGASVGRPPGDLLAYQQVLHRVRPDWVIDIRTAAGGRAYFFATILELLGHGQVVSLDADHQPDLPQHDRLTYLTRDPAMKATADRVREMVGDGGRVVLVLGARANRPRLDRELELYGSLVPVGSYVVIEDTIINGHPVWPGFGAGPAEVVKNILNTSSDFVPDEALERAGVTFNPGGFLRRVR